MSYGSSTPGGSPDGISGRGAAYGGGPRGSNNGQNRAGYDKVRGGKPSPGSEREGSNGPSQQGSGNYFDRLRDQRRVDIEQMREINKEKEKNKNKNRGQDKPRSYDFERAIEKAIGANPDDFAKQRQEQAVSSSPVGVREARSAFDQRGKASRAALAPTVAEKTANFGVVGGVMGMGGSGAISQGLGFNPGFNPEMGGTTTPEITGPAKADEGRKAQAEMIERQHGSAFSAFGRGDITTGLEIAARKAGSVLGITEEMARDPVTGAWGSTATFQPVSLLANMPVGIGALGALQAAKLGLQYTAGNIMATAVGERATMNKAAGMMGPGFDLGFRPTTGTVTRAQAREAAGTALSAVDQMALDYEARRANAAAAYKASRESGRGDPDPVALTEPLPIGQPVMPNPSPTPPSTPTNQSRGFRGLSGRDPRLGVDVLRTGEQAKVAAGIQAPRPTVNTVFRSGRPGALI